MTIDYRVEILNLADTSYGQWEQAGLPWEARERSLLAAIDGLLVNTDPLYIPVKELLSRRTHRAVSIPHRRPRTGVSKTTAAYVFARDSLQCQHCGATDGLTIDHVLPVSAGGSDDITNLQTLCRSCNSRKGAKQ